MGWGQGSIPQCTPPPPSPPGSLQQLPEDGPGWELLTLPTPGLPGFPFHAEQMLGAVLVHEKRGQQSHRRTASSS